MRAAALTGEQRGRPEAVKQAMLAHLCRCTGWQSVVESIVGFGLRPQTPVDPSASTARARLEGGRAQLVGRHVALGMGGFADDRAPTERSSPCAGPTVSGWSPRASLRLGR